MMKKNPKVFRCNQAKRINHLWAVVFVGAYVLYKQGSRITKLEEELKNTKPAEGE